MGPSYETTNGWQNATPEELEEAMEEMKGLFEYIPFEKRFQKEQYRITQRKHSRNNARKTL